MKRIILLAAVAITAQAGAQSLPISQSPTFKALSDRVGTVEKSVNASAQLSLDKTGNCRALAVQDVVASASIATGCSDGAMFHTTDRNVPIDPRIFGAKGDGTSDDTAAMQAAIVAARAQNRPVGARGVFRIDGTLDPAGVSFLGVDRPYMRTNLDPLTWGFVIEHNNAAGPLFAPTSCGSSFDGVVLYDLRQPGSGSAPVTRPAMFDIANTCTDFTMRDSVVVNAYDLFKVESAAVIGDWRLTSNRIYAVHFGFDIAGTMPEAAFLTDNIWSPGVWQQAAVFGNGGMLAKWTTANGAVIHIDSGSNSIDGMRSSNELFYAYRSWLRIDSGRLNVSSAEGPGWDSVPQPIVTTGTASIILNVSGGYTYAQPYGDTASSLPAFAIGGSGAREVSINGHSLLFGSGKAVELTGMGAGIFEWRGGDIQNWGQGSSASNVPGMTAQAPATRVTWAPARMLCSKPDQVGAIVADARTLVTKTTWENCVRFMDVQATPTLLLGVDSSLVVNSGQSPTFTNANTVKFSFNGVYDK